MTLKKHFVRVFWEVSMACGALLVLLTVFYQAAGTRGMSLEGMWRIVLLGSTIVLRGTSLVNFHDLDDRAMRINYLISSVLADATLIVLLVWYTPGGAYFAGRGWLLLAVYVVFKGLFYSMNYVHAWISARDINAHLLAMKNHTER